MFCPFLMSSLARITSEVMGKYVQYALELRTQIIMTEDHQQMNSDDEVIYIDATENKIFHINDSELILKVKGVSKSGIH